MINLKNSITKISLVIFIVLGFSFFSAHFVFAATSIITDVGAINIMGPGAQITWTTDIPSDSMVMYGTAPGSYANTSTWRCDAGGMVVSHCINLTPLDSSMVYYYVVKSADSSGVYSISPEKTFTSASFTSANNIAPTVPSTPTGSLTGTINTFYTYSTYLYPDSNGDQVKAIFDWGDGTTSYTSYMYPISSGSSVSSDHSWATAGTYHIKVRTQDYAGLESNWTGTLTVTIGGETTTDTIPAMPSNLRGAGSTSASISLAWNDNSANEDKFNVERKLSTSGNYSLVIQTGENVTTHTDTSVTASTGYDYRIQACRSGYGCSDYTYVYGLYTAAGSTPPTTDTISPYNPSAPSIYSYASSSITFGWTAPGDDGTAGIVSGYEIRYSTLSQGTMTLDQWWLQAATLPAITYDPTTFVSSGGIQKATISGLSSNTTYYIAAKARDEVPNWSTPSGVISSTTTSTTTATIATIIPAMPSNLRGAGSTSASISLAWNDNSANEDKFNVERKLSTSGNYSLVIQTGENVTTHTDTSVTASTGYDYRIQACRSGYGCSDYTYVYGLYTATSGNISTTAAVKIIKGKITYPDGKAVTNAGIGAYNSASGLWANAYSDSSGNYSIKISGGKWQVGVYPSIISGQISDWVYTKSAVDVSFADGLDREETTVNFQVELTQVSVKGYILKPDGTAPTTGMAGISFKDAYGYEHKAYIDQNGYFFIYLISGSYTIQVFSLDSQFGAPTSLTLSVVQGEQKDLGKLYLISNAEKIIGKVTNASGAGVSNVWVNANQYSNNKFVQTKTLSDGSYELMVSAGEWELNVYSDSATGYYYTQGYKKVMVSAGQMIEINFSLNSTDSQISGNILDSHGQILTDIYGSVYAGSFGGSIEKGAFSFKVSPGTHILYVYLPSDSKYSPPPFQTATVLSGESKKVNFAVSALNSTISGSFKNNAGNLVTSLSSDKVKVYVSAKSGAWYNAQINPSQSSYSVNVSAGAWYLNYWVDPASGYISTGANVEINVSAGQTYTFDIVLAKSDSFISGVTKSSDGKVLANVWVSIDTAGFTATATVTATTGSVFVAGGNSDVDGNFTISVPAGVYYIHAYYSPTFGYINPSEIKVEVLAGKTTAVDLIFRKPEVKVSGATSMSGAKTSAFVWAWGELGGYAETKSDSNGSYSLNISKNNKWHVSASADINGVYYKSADIVIDVQDQISLSQDLVLTSVYTFVQKVEKIVESTQTQSISLTDGAKVILPANSISSTGNVNVTLKPTADTPSFGNTSVVGTSYEVEAKDAIGQTISNLNSEITITIPYSEEDLAAKGLKPKDLTLSFFDETTSSWKALEKQVIDQKSKVVSGVVSHLTRFALVAPADTTPPPSPSSIKASLLADKTIKITWINPKLDFSHSRIYRSEKLSELGDLVYNNITAESQIDSNVIAGKTYYYTVKSMDLAGNGSTNTEQVNAAPGIASVVSLAPGFQFTQSLKRGAKSDEVKKLQELLAKDKNIYPKGLITGYFGLMTEAAVKKFQTKYGIKSLGIVGPKTRVKLNELFSRL